MSWGWTIAISLWLFGVTALWDECYDLLARMAKTVRRTVRLLRS